MDSSMRPEALAKLHDAADLLALTRAVLSLCEPFGPVHSFRLIHNRRAGRVACFIELEAPKHHGALRRAVGGHGVGDAVCLDIPVREGFEAPHGAVALGASADSRRRTHATSRSAQQVS